MTLLPLVTADQVAFWILAPVIVLCALGVVLLRKPVHSAVSMAGVMVSLAVLYAAQDAPFLFVVQIIVYTGAILMLFLFVVMLIGTDVADSFVETIQGHRFASVLASAGLGLLLVLAVGQYTVVGGPAGLQQANTEHGGNLEGISALLFHDYVFLFEAVAALLIIGAVGAMVLQHGERLSEKKTQVSEAGKRMDRYIEEGIDPGPTPSSGVFAQHNSISTPALLADGSPARASVSPTLAGRGAITEAEELAAPAVTAIQAIEQAEAEARGDA
ncbi:MAG: NADH:ubiquinone oxidoreductase subunit J [Arachnia propionica]|nr:MAG: NADH:ubiquinone oxidoreductase subunit J [Arachnia propionica]